jgi:hypothetical protein
MNAMTVELYRARNRCNSMRPATGALDAVGGQRSGEHSLSLAQCWLEHAHSKSCVHFHR